MVTSMVSIPSSEAWTLWKSGSLVSRCKASWPQGAFSVSLGMWREGRGPLRKAGFPDFSACFVSEPLELPMLIQRSLSMAAWPHFICQIYSLASSLSQKLVQSVGNTDLWTSCLQQGDYHSVLSTDGWNTCQAHLGNFNTISTLWGFWVSWTQSLDPSPVAHYLTHKAQPPALDSTWCNATVMVTLIWMNL